MSDAGKFERFLAQVEGVLDDDLKVNIRLRGLAREATKRILELSGKIADLKAEIERREHEVEHYQATNRLMWEILDEAGVPNCVSDELYTYLNLFYKKCFTGTMFIIHGTRFVNSDETEVVAEICFESSEVRSTIEESYHSASVYYVSDFYNGITEPCAVVTWTGDGHYDHQWKYYDCEFFGEETEEAYYNDRDD